MNSELLSDYAADSFPIEGPFCQNAQEDGEASAPKQSIDNCNIFIHGRQQSTAKPTRYLNIG